MNFFINGFSAFKWRVKRGLGEGQICGITDGFVIWKQGALLLTVSSHSWECQSHHMWQAKYNGDSFWAMLFWGEEEKGWWFEAGPRPGTALGEVGWGGWECKRCFLATIKRSLLVLGPVQSREGEKNHLIQPFLYETKEKQQTAGLCDISQNEKVS